MWFFVVFVSYYCGFLTGWLVAKQDTLIVPSSLLGRCQSLMLLQQNCPIFLPLLSLTETRPNKAHQYKKKPIYWCSAVHVTQQVKLSFSIHFTTRDTVMHISSLLTQSCGSVMAIIKVNLIIMRNTDFLYSRQSKCLR